MRPSSLSEPCTLRLGRLSAEWLYLITIQLSSSNKSVTDGGEVGKINVSLRGDAGAAKDMHLYDRCAIRTTLRLLSA